MNGIVWPSEVLVCEDCGSVCGFTLEPPGIRKVRNDLCHCHLVLMPFRNNLPRA